MRRILTVVSVPLFAAMVLGACGGSDSTSSTADTSDATVATEAGSDSSDTAATDAGQTDASTAETEPGSADTESSSADTAGGGSSTIDFSTWTETDLATVCALAPKDKVEAIVGVTVEEPIGGPIPGAVSTCSYYGGGADGQALPYGIMAEIDLSAFDWTTVVQLGAVTVAAGGPPPADCSIGGRTALCEDGFDPGNGAGASLPTVSVKAGGDADPTIVVSSAAGLEQTKAIAELVVANLGL